MTSTTRHHKIPVNLVPGTPAEPGPHAVPEIPQPLMAVGDTVHYFSNDGEVIVEFFENSSPFQDADGSEMKVISSNDPPSSVEES